MPLIVVEGETDVAFFRQLSPMRGLGLQVQSANGVSNITPTVRRLLVPGDVSQLLIAEDMDARSSEQVILSRKQSIGAVVGQQPVDLSPAGDRFEVSRAVVAIIPMGLPDDQDLHELGITSHALEDYLIKLLLHDSSLRPSNVDLKGLLLELANTIRSHGVAFDSSKELFQLVKPIVKHGFSDTGVVEALFAHAEPAILHRVMDPLVARLAQATEPLDQ